MSQEVKCVPAETNVCCCVDVGTVLDNSDSTANVELIAESEQAANEQLQRLAEKAAEVASEPCQIKSEVVAAEGGFKLAASFTFSCQAESMIFELALR